MNFEQLYAPSLKELFVQKLRGMILSATSIGSSSRSLTACPSVTLCAP